MMRLSKAWALGGLTLAVIAAAASTWWAYQGLSRLAQVRQGLAALEARKATLEALLPQAQARERASALGRQVEQDLARLGLAQAQWGAQRIQRQAADLSRREAEAALHELSGSADRRFGADAFEIAVASPGAGLFTPPAADDKGIRFSAAGTLHFRLGR
ncbi:MAG: hypothetical protein AB1768_10895 [Pseudomonadota bacterium]|jgi:hypothetical protein